MVNAVEINPTTFPTIFPPARFGDVASLLNIIIPILFSGAAFAFLVIMFWGAITWLTAGGNKDQVAQAKKIITYAVFGIIIITVSYLLVQLIKVVFNL